jgi:hypothetical protein
MLPFLKETAEIAKKATAQEAARTSRIGYEIK